MNNHAITIDTPVPAKPAFTSVPAGLCPCPACGRYGWYTPAGRVNPTMPEIAGDGQGHGSLVAGNRILWALNAVVWTAVGIVAARWAL